MERATRPDRGYMRERREVLRTCSRAVASKLRPGYVQAQRDRLQGILLEIKRLQSIANDIQFQIESYDRDELVKQLAKYVLEIGCIEATLETDENLPGNLSPEGFIANYFTTLVKESNND